MLQTEIEYDVKRAATLDSERRQILYHAEARIADAIRKGKGSVTTLAAEAFAAYPELQLCFPNVQTFAAHLSTELPAMYGIPMTRITTSAPARTMTAGSQVKLRAGQSVRFAAGEPATFQGARFTALAYGGDVVFGFTDLILNVKGVEPWSQQLPVLKEHNRDAVAGYIDAVSSENGVLSIAGRIHDSPVGREVMALAAQGHKWQLSVGVSIRQTRDLVSGERATVNGKPVAGPVTIIEKALLLECSVVSVGASRGTTFEVV